MSVIKMILFSPEKLKLRRISSAWLLSLIHECSDLTMGAMTLSRRRLHRKQTSIDYLNK